MFKEQSLFIASLSLIDFCSLDEPQGCYLQMNCLFHFFTLRHAEREIHT